MGWAVNGKTARGKNRTGILKLKKKG